MNKVLAIIVLAITIVAGQANATSIAVNGNNPTEVGYGSVYQDQGATVTYNDSTTAQVAGEGNVDTKKSGTYSVNYSATDTDESGETATATRTVNVVGGGVVRIFKIPSIIDYSVIKLEENTYQINTVAKNLPIRASSQIKWGKDLDEVSFAEWQPYGEIITVYTEADQIILWPKNSDSTGKLKTIRLK